MIATFFTCGWKPVLSWLCVALFLWAYMLASVVEAIIFLKTGVVISLIKADTMPMLELAFTTLGIGGLHSHDKLRGLYSRGVSDV